MRNVQNVPWGLAFIGSVTSQVGNAIGARFDLALSSVFNNSTYQKTGLLFGSKIIEDVSKIRVSDANLNGFIGKFYKRCMVPDLNWGKRRANGYTLDELVHAPNLLEFLSDHSSNARTISYKSNLIKDNSKVENTIDKEISCNKAAKLIKTQLEAEIDKRVPKLASSFLSYFYHDKPIANNDEVFKSILEGSYGIFLKGASQDAKTLLLQNVMINAVSDVSTAKAYSNVATAEMTRAAQLSVSQMAQKFVVILRAVLECLFYGTFPLILILMVTPIGMEVLKNYGFGFVYLQLWQPMYSILFCMASAWGTAHASGIESLTFASQERLSHINDEISAVSGYMIASIPVLSIFITKGMVSSMGNLANSIMYIPQTAAVQNAENAVKGNYQLGTTSVDTHSYNNTSANKYDDNHSWMSGMKSLSMSSGASQLMFGDGRQGINSSGSVSNTAGLLEVDWNQAYGQRLDQSINDNMSKAEHYASRSSESASSGYAKLLGFDKSFAKGSNVYEDWRKGLSSEDRASVDEARSHVDKVSQSKGVSQQDALKLAVAANFGIGRGGQRDKIVTAGISLAGDASTNALKQEGSNQSVDSSYDQKFSDNLSNVRNIATSSSHQEGTSINNSMVESAKSDFSSSKSASLESSRSFDRAHSLQETKGAFEQNSTNITQKLTNMATEKGIQEYGAAGFENLIRNKPQETKAFVNKFADELISKDTGGIKSEFANQKADLNQSGISGIKDDYHKNQNSVSRLANENINKAKEEAPKNFQENIIKKTDGGIKRKVNQDMDKKELELKSKKTGIESNSDKLANKVLAKNKQSATGVLVDSWNPSKKNE
jgi:conjugal transfer mating pair stabilization protein TraG